MGPAEGGLAALRRVLGGPQTRWILDRVRQRLLAARRGGDGAALSGVIWLRDPSQAQRVAVTKLIGRPKREGTALRVDLALLDGVLRRGLWPPGLADAVEALDGPIIDPRIGRADEAAAWEAAYRELDEAAATMPGLEDWWRVWCRGGGLKRSVRAEAARLGLTVSPGLGADLVRQLAAVLAALPSSGEPVAVFARRVLGDAHGLDRDRPLGRLAGAAVQTVFGPADRAAPSADEADADSVRDTWQAAGVVLSNVASTVLCLGVAGAGRAEGAGAPPAGLAAATARALEAMRAVRAPLILTLDQVRSGGVAALPGEAVVHVCENPTIVEVIAQRWAKRPDAGPVVVCTSGQPSHAAIALLARLIEGGAECRYHGDFDWAGLRIASAIGRQVPWTPWRFAARDYREAARHSAETGLPSVPLRGTAAESPWDPALAAAMGQHGLAIEEEAVAQILADDVLREAPQAGQGLHRHALGRFGLGADLAAVPIMAMGVPTPPPHQRKNGPAESP